MDKYKFTFGADPEFFVYEKKNRSLIPACRLFGGDKGSPMFLSPDGGYLEDGTTVEFNVTPCSTLSEVRSKIANLILVFLNKHDKYIFSRYSSATFEAEQLAKFPEALHIGCSPDLFAYGLRTTPSIARFENKRFAGGHLHVGIDPWPEGLEKDALVKFVDLLFVLPACHKYADRGRWPFYGHPGLYRETKYGIECRSPDNYWCNPAFYAQTGETNREWVDGHITQFDRVFASLETILNFDEHGARLNHDIRTYVKSTGIQDLMGSLQVLESPTQASNYQGYAGETEHWVRRWSQERDRIHDNRINARGLRGST